MPDLLKADCPHRRLHGFLLADPVSVPELQATAFHARHERTGFRVLCLEANDPENLLAVCIPTMPSDRTGVPHIAEHVVLGGSRSYPLHDPFVELLKCSMATFANAMTYADRTVFPVASNVPDDFRNLARVYLDAVFHPLLRWESFAQEGHILVPEAGRLHRQGIVYNEMRGAYADLDTVAQNAFLARILADTPYQYDAGGHPDAIPSLTYDQFLAFCHAHYRPDRALGFCYGDLGVDCWLQLHAEALADLPTAPSAAAPAIPPAPSPWSTPRACSLPVSLGEEEDEQDRSAVLLGWYLGTQGNLEDVLAGDFLDHLLLGNPGSPLRQAITESELGDDLFLPGCDSERYHALFQVGLRGCDPADAPAFEGLVLGLLEQLVAHGIPDTTILGALNQMEYSRRLIDDQYAITLAETVFGAWVYGLDPLQHLSLEEPLQQLRERALGDPTFVPALIRDRLLRNNHRLLLACQPDPSLERTERDRAEAELAALHASASTADRVLFARQFERLQEWQETPDDPDALARLPRLAPSRIPPHPPQTATETVPTGTGLLLATNVFAAGLEECHQAFPLPDLPPDLVDLLPFFAYCLGRLDTATYSYPDLAARIAVLGAQIGGSYSLSSAPALDLSRPIPVLLLRCSCLGSELGPALDLAWEILANTRFAAGPRLAELLRQRRSRLLANVLSDAHVVASHQATATFSPTHDIRCRWYGPAQLRFADRLGQSADLAAVAADLQRIRQHLLRVGPGVLSRVGGSAGLPLATSYLQRFPQTATSGAPPPDPAIDTAIATHTILAFPAQGAHVASCLPAPRLTDPAAPLLDLGAHLLSLGEAWDTVRAQGGAYGASCEYDPVCGTLSFLSYRDPSPHRTLQAFHDMVGRPHDWPEHLVREAIPAIARQDQHPPRPSHLARQALFHHLHGITYALRDQYRQRLLHATSAQVREALAAAFAAFPDPSTCVIGDAHLVRTCARHNPSTVSTLL